MVFLPLVAVVVLMGFLAALSNLSQGHEEEDRQQLEAVLRRSAVACYAAEGAYPPDLEYLKEHYGVQVNDRRYIVDYILIADNLMPDITVLDK